MPDPLLNLWPARVITPDAAYGSTDDRVRALLYERADGVLRLVVISAAGVVLNRATAASYQHNGQGMDVLTEDGETWTVLALGGCPSCGGGASDGLAWQIIQRGDEIAL